jgi:hypothetical protein
VKRSAELFPLFDRVPGPCACGGGPQSGSRWSARSAARTNVLEADEDPPHTLAGPGTRRRRCGSSHLRPPVNGQQVSTLRVPAPSLIWVRGRKSGDMMIDGVPDVRAAEGSVDARRNRLPSSLGPPQAPEKSPTQNSTCVLAEGVPIRCHLSVNATPHRNRNFRRDVFDSAVDGLGLKHHSAQSS